MKKLLYNVTITPVAGDAVVFEDGSGDSYTGNGAAAYGQMMTKSDIKVDGHFIPFQSIAQATYEVTSEAVEAPKDDFCKENDDEDQEFKVVYDLAGGATTSDTTEFTGLKVGDTTPTIADPTKADYVFDGWDPEVAATVAAEDADEDLTITYTATWKADQNNG